MMTMFEEISEKFFRRLNDHTVWADRETFDTTLGEAEQSLGGHRGDFKARVITYLTGGLV